MADDSRTQTVSLGCGTLILIALIVLIFGRGDTGKVEREVRALRIEVEKLSDAVANQSAQLKTVADSVDRLVPAEAPLQNRE